jgi:hypothetical protein
VKLSAFCGDLTRVFSVSGIAALGQEVRDNRSRDSAANTATDKARKNTLKNLPIYVHVLIGFVAGMVSGPLGALVYFIFIENLLANQSLHRCSKVFPRMGSTLPLPLDDVPTRRTDKNYLPRPERE